MTLSARTRLGPYEILSPIGAGGMGEVYRAKDTRLGRDVAVKVLPSHLSESPELKQRFEREAKAISQLTHPHICTLYDVGSQDGVEYLVMELLEGETLSDRLGKGPLPRDQVIRCGIEITEALEKAHRAGIVHRDLKPGNIMLTRSGVKLLDFGLAKMVAGPVLPAEVTSLPTEGVRGAPLTEQGTVMGTFQYMAPEQLEGGEADARSDIFALGAVLYEMATAHKAFTGKSRVSLIGSILKDEPPAISTIAPMTPPALDRLVQTCLAKDPEDRIQTAHDVNLQLKWIAEGGSQAGIAAPVVALRRRRDRVSWAIVGALAGLLLGAAAVWGVARRVGGTQPVTRLAVPIPVGDSFVMDHYSSVAISPDGRRVVYVGRRADKRQLFLRALDAAEVTPVAGTEGAYSPFFSPDGRWVGFWAEGKIKKVALSGGESIVVCECGGLDGFYGADWGHDDTIVLSRGWAQGLERVPASGGPPQSVTKVSAKGADRGHLWPEILPGNKAVLFTIFTGGSLEDFQIAAVSLATGEKKVLIKGGTYGRYAASGHLLYLRGGTLFAVPFDPRRLEVTGAAFPVAEGVFENTNRGGGYAVSRDGTMLYAPGGLVQTQASLLWVDRHGTATPATKIKRPFQNPSISPDGTRIAVLVAAETYDIWILDLDRDSLTRLSFGKDDVFPIWSPDGKRVVYASSKPGVYNLYARAADGSGSDEPLTSEQEPSVPQSFSPDGKLLVFDKTRGEAGEIWIYPLEKGSSPRPFLQGPFLYSGGRLSPDGRWLAYQSNESGKWEVYVAAFPGPGGKWQISTDGGEQALWGPSGKEIFFAHDKKAMRAAVTTTPTFSASRPDVLFEGDYQGWTIAPDGNRFLVVKDETAASAPNHLNLVLNWLDDLKRRASAASAR
jgi:Tol biopolymer transport system component